MLAVVGIIIFVALGLFVAAQSKAHRQDTGVAAPSRKASANIRRHARKKGISEQQAYAEWLKREQLKR